MQKIQVVKDSLQSLDSQGKDQQGSKPQQKKQTFPCYQELFQKMNKLRIQGLTDNDLQLPQICVVGNQSSGKSSLLSSLSNGLRFPEASGTCTKCPTIVHLSNKPILKIQVGWFEKAQDLLENDINKEILKTFETFEEAQTEISNVQQRLLNNKGVDSNFTSDPVIVKVYGPTQVDLTLVDLPGIIQFGDGKQEVEDMIKGYITSEMSLILVVRKADDDNENVEALRVAKEVNEDFSRTLQVITHCDRMKEQTKKPLKNWLLDDEDNLYGAHAVCCRVNENMLDETQELTILQQLFKQKIPRSGIKSLQKRLQILLFDYIKQNIPNLIKQQRQKQKNAEKILKKIGEVAPQSFEILNTVKNNLQESNQEIEYLIHLKTKKFQEDVKNVGIKLTKEQILKKYRPTVFSTPQQMGFQAFENQVKDIALKEFKPIAVVYMNCVLKEIQHLKVAQCSSLRLKSQIQKLWKNEFAKIQKKVLSEIRQCCILETQYSTLNNFQETFSNQLLYPPNFSFLFLESIMPQDIYSKDPKQQLPLETVKSNIGIKLKNVIDKFSSAQDDNKTQQSQQNELVVGIKSYFPIMQKNFTDNVFKIITYYCKIPREEWIDKEITHNKMLQEQASEPRSITNKRKRLLDIIRSCEMSLEILFSM